MTFRVKKWTTSDGPHWERIETRSNPATFGQSATVAASGGKPSGGRGSQRRKAAWAVLDDGGDRALTLNRGAQYDVTLDTGSGATSSVVIDATAKIAVLPLLGGTTVVSVLADGKPVDAAADDD